jgi:hypothetical protein
VSLDVFDVDDAADTLRFIPISADATSIYDITPCHVDRTAAHRRLLIRTTRHDISRLRKALAAGWDVGPELAYEERCLAALEGGK